MDLRRSSAFCRLQAFAVLLLLAGIVIEGCERDDTVQIDRNLPPETYVTRGPDNSTDPEDPTDLYYRAHLYWRGEDQDGTIAGFRFAVDDTSDRSLWQWTTATDSVFRFQAGEIGAMEHLFLIRAVDNEGKEDPSPDTLRFESNTTARPLVHFCLDKFEVNGVRDTLQGCINPDTKGPCDTVVAFSTVKYVWTGSDADGEVVAWESKYDREEAWTAHEREDTTRTVVEMQPGTRVMQVRGIDDAGAKSEFIGKMYIQSNFDPKTNIDRSSITAWLPTPWAVEDTLWVNYLDSLGVVQDTLPSRGMFTFCWSSSDSDGYVVDYTWRLKQFVQTTTATCDSSPGPLAVVDAGTGEPLTVKGRDNYGQLETPADTVWLFIDFQPEVNFVNPPATVPYGALARFPFEGRDKDSDPDSLQYEWRFSWQGTWQGPAFFDPGSLYIEEEMLSQNQGSRSLIIRAQDSGGVRRRSEPDTVFFRIVPPGPGN